MYKDKVVLITGGSRGIGANMVKGLAQEGYKIILNYNKSENLAKKIQADLQNIGIEIKIFQADVSIRNNVKALANYCISQFGKIDVLINNAGISQIKMFCDITDEDWSNMIQTNLTANFYTSQECLKYMIKRKQGCIINISSIWGIVGGSCEVHYSTAKAGLNGMTKALAKELGPSNIRVNSIAPGIIDTDMNADLSEEDLENLKQEIPLQKIGHPQSITNCVKWLIEDNYTTGQIISINGGWA